MNKQVYNDFLSRIKRDAVSSVMFLSGFMEKHEIFGLITKAFEDYERKSDKQE